jgi:hypothetical protein
MVLALAACGDDGTDPENGGEADTGLEDTGGSDETSAFNWTAALYRTESLNITRPAHVGPLLNGLIAPDIREGRLHILIETSDFSAESGAATFMLFGGSGDLDQETGLYSVSGDGNPVPAVVEADGSFVNTEPLSLDFAAIITQPPSCDGDPCDDNSCRDDDDCNTNFECDTEGEGQCLQFVVIPLQDLNIDGTFQQDEEGNPILDAITLDGAILKTDADGIELDLGTGTPTVLTNLLQENRMDYPADAVEYTGWILTAIISGVQVNNE